MNRTKLYAVLDKDFQYEYYCKITMKAGERIRIGGRQGHELKPDGLYLLIGHGVKQPVPPEYYHLEEV